MTHPYRGLPASQFWNSAVSGIAPGSLDPVIDSGFRISVDDAVATLGSCFAQHLAASIRDSGYRYLVTEQAPPGAAPEVAATYGIFSARYGNIYTVRQAVQLLERAFDDRTFDDDVWTRENRWYDALRPTVEPGGFATAEELAHDRARHLDSVRRLFLESDVVVFTLGLTEGWRSRVSGAVYPIAPGVAAGAFDPEHHEFFNGDYPSVRADLEEWLRLLRRVNPSVRVLLTVSPVPLAATYEKRHVWASTTYSKAVLLAVAQDVARAEDLVDYFPSFEIITSPLTNSQYYEDDLRSVRDRGVRHVMRVFRRHYLEADEHQAQHDTAAQLAAYRIESTVICDEDLLAYGGEPSGEATV
ncbi:MAG: hypothetical protein F2842_09090 [Actinobacteria bacterium]|uniref:Unannotated protein n=1 Tax=freshwater metagenome TaxID=449393 RepID=A0A6J7KSH6_9ZZZZ|nr:hypothetical protein [Actinomycetota bacterium]